MTTKHESPDVCLSWECVGAPNWMDNMLNACKDLPKAERKRLQIEHAPHISRRAKLVKLADKICNLRDIANSPPEDWLLERRHEYFDWAKAVVDGLRGVHPGLEAIFDAAYDLRPAG